MSSSGRIPEEFDDILAYRVLIRDVLTRDMQGEPLTFSDREVRSYVCPATANILEQIGLLTTQVSLVVYADDVDINENDVIQFEGRSYEPVDIVTYRDEIGPMYQVVTIR